MLVLSDSAREELQAYFDDRGEQAAVRVFLANGCSGVRLSLAIDEAGEEDETFDSGGFTFVVAKDLLELTGNLNIDLGPMGFDITSDNPIDIGDSGGGCSGCPSAGACGA